MTLKELLTALREQMHEAGVPAKGSTADLAFVASRSRNGEIEVDFVDAAAMSKPRPEQLHRLELALDEVADSPIELAEDEAGNSEKSLEGGLFKKSKPLDSPSSFRHSAKPPSLPPPRGG